MVRFFLPVTALAGIMLVGLGDCSTGTIFSASLLSFY